MKIGVVTVHDSANFGSFLQAYALNKVLEDMGHDVYFIHTRDKQYIKNIFYNFKICRQSVLHPFSYLQSYFFGRKKYKLFKIEQECFKEAESYEELKPDAIILGSDEIWNVKTPVFTKSIFYGKGMENIAAYAVSAGLAVVSDFDRFSELQSLIKKIKTVLVRDNNTADIVEKITGEKPEIVCDPTFLIDKSRYVKPYSNSFIENNDYILVYAYEIEKKNQEIIKEFARKNKLKLLSVCFYYDWCDHSIICSPLQFCRIMEKAKYVITTTFHGTIFSVLNHKRFVSVPISQKTNDVIKRVGLEDTIIDFKELNSAILEDKLLNNVYDYDKVEKKIADFRNKSLELLKKSLEELQ